MILPPVERMILASGADVRIGGDRAYCEVGSDFIRVPPPQVLHERIDGHRTAENYHRADDDGARCASGCVLITVTTPTFVSGRIADSVALTITMVVAARLPRCGLLFRLASRHRTSISRLAS